MFSNDTIAAIATPPGEGGIAIVRLSGPESHHIAARLFRSRRTGDGPPFGGYEVRYGQFVDEQTGGVEDDGLLTTFRAPHSYTGEEAAELSCHGGRATTARLLALALQAGARLAEPGEFTRRAFLNGRLDLAQAEAVADVIRARTDMARRMAHRQLEGQVSHAIGRLKDELIGVLAAIEVTIDFSDEVGELEYAPLRARLASVRTGVERLLSDSRQGRVLREGLRAAIVGRPNVGKSSLLNALLRTDRAIVTPIAGTTRDLLEESATIGGVPVVLVDTAGLRETEDMVERIGVERAKTALAHADVVLWVRDAAEHDAPPDELLTMGSMEPTRVVAVLNKRDLLTDAETDAQLQQMSVHFSNALAVSAQTGQGLAELEAALLQAGGVTNSPERGESETVLVSSARHQQALSSALNSLREAEATALRELPGDFIAIDARGALDALGLITGETVTDDVIHRIFRDFCVGK